MKHPRSVLIRDAKRLGLKMPNCPIRGKRILHRPIEPGIAFIKSLLIGVQLRNKTNEIDPNSITADKIAMNKLINLTNTKEG